MGVFMGNECHAVKPVGLENVHQPAGVRCLTTTSDHSLSRAHNCCYFCRKMGVIVNQCDVIFFATNIEAPCNTLEFCKHLSDRDLSCTETQRNGKSSESIEHIMHSTRTEGDSKTALPLVFVQNISSNVDHKSHARSCGFNLCGR